MNQNKKIVKFIEKKKSKFKNDSKEVFIVFVMVLNIFVIRFYV